MNNKIKSRRWWSEGAQIRRWHVLFLFLLVIFNTFMFGVLLSFFLRPQYAPIPISGDVALGLHLQIFEAFLAALAIGLAVFGFVGYGALRQAAEGRAEVVAREFLQASREVGSSAPDDVAAAAVADMPETPDLKGSTEPGGREPEKDV